MPRIQTFVSNEIEAKLNDIISVKRMEGASFEEANVSGTTAMLIELGIRVYELQQQKKEGGFSQVEFNKVMLENMMKTSLMCQKLMIINAKNSEVSGMEEFKLGNMASQVKDGVEAVMEHFFPSSEEE